MFADSTTASWGTAAGGAVRWLAPEVLKGSRSTYKSDVYAFGCVCLEVRTAVDVKNVALSLYRSTPGSLHSPTSAVTRK